MRTSRIGCARSRRRVGSLRSLHETFTIRNMKNVGAVIRAARVKRKLSLREAARLSQVSAATLSKLEAGAINPTLATMQALTTTLGIKPAEWFD